jgi:hypothetical protein
MKSSISPSGRPTAASKKSPGSREVPGAGFVAGILSGVLAIAQLLVAGLITFFLLGVGDQRNLLEQEFPGEFTDSQADRVESQIAQYGWPVVAVSVVFTFGPLFAAVDLLRFRFSGWIVAIVCGGCTIVFSGTLVYFYWFALDQLHVSANAMNNAPRAEEFHQFAARSKTTLSWMFWIPFCLYAGYSLLIAVTLWRPAVFRAYFSAR